jgi:hypothetical protein
MSIIQPISSLEHIIFKFEQAKQSQSYLKPVCEDFEEVKIIYPSDMHTATALLVLKRLQEAKDASPSIMKSLAIQVLEYQKFIKSSVQEGETVRPLIGKIVSLCVAKIEAQSRGEEVPANAFYKLSARKICGGCSPENACQNVHEILSDMLGQEKYLFQGLGPLSLLGDGIKIRRQLEGSGNQFFAIPKTGSFLEVTGHSSGVYLKNGRNAKKDDPPPDVAWRKGIDGYTALFSDGILEFTPNIPDDIPLPALMLQCRLSRILKAYREFDPD